MKKILIALIICSCLAACKDAEKGKFTVTGELKNAGDQKIYLEQIFFSQKDPQVLDTGEIKNGKFSVSTIGNEEGLYQLRLEKDQAAYVFINDKPDIGFKGDVKEQSLTGFDFNSPANKAFKNLMVAVDKKQMDINMLSQEIDSLEKNKSSDSTIKAKIIDVNAAAADFKILILKNIDTVSDPVIAMFALGYTKGIDPSELKMLVPALAKRFPAHQGIAELITLYNQMITQSAMPQPAPSAGSVPGTGSIAPELTMTDTAGRSFSLSSLKGKYVLVDFWASWCGPCRAENPNVVANYNKYKNKNFTVLGVSLDENKAEWIKAINKDHLSWMHVSDLKGWGSAATNIYGFDAIPYNTLIDPQGKIIATELRGDALSKKLEEVLK